MFLAHFIDDGDKQKPSFPFLCLTVSGGHTQIVLIRDHLDMEIIGSTIDDAAGEAFDKTANFLAFLILGDHSSTSMQKTGIQRHLNLQNQTWMATIIASVV